MSAIVDASASACSERPRPRVSGRRTHASGWLLRAASFAARARRHVAEQCDPYGRRLDALKTGFYGQLWTSAARRAGATVDDLGHGVLRIARGRHETFVSGSLVMLDSPVTLKMAGNKPLVYELLRAGNYPVGCFCEYELGRLRSAEAFLDRVGSPAVVKPAASGAAGRGVTTGVRSRRDLRSASIAASTYSRTLLIEPQAEGSSYRLLYLDGKFIDAIERRPPRVQGDGRLTIGELIREENDRRVRAGAPTAFHVIGTDLELTQYLATQDLTLRSVPAANRWIALKRVVNQNNASENSSVRDRVHPSTVRRGAEVARQLKIRLAGIDVMTTDLSQPLEDTGGIINEVNTTPALHHHYLIDDPEQSAPVVDCLLEVLLAPKGFGS